MAGSRRRSRKKLKPSCQVRDRVDEQEIVDDNRVSNLPDHILHHILSFLDSKLAVQTSLVSRRWRFLWRDVGTLNFNRYTFRNMGDFARHVRNLLSSLIRSQNDDDSTVVAAVSSICFDFGVRPGVRAVHLPREAYTNDDDRASIGIRPSDSCVAGHLKILEMAASILMIGGNVHRDDHHRHEYLKTLKLKAALLKSASTLPLCFKFVTNLELQNCRVDFSDDTFAGLPCLNYLKLDECQPSVDVSLKVSGVPHLSRLEILIPADSWVQGMEVSAPELKSLYFSGPVLRLVELNLPNLHSASIRLEWEVLRDRLLEFMNLLRGLHNVTSLDLCFDKVLRRLHWQPHRFPLTAMKCLMKSSSSKDKSSPFTNLKRLRVRYPQKPPTVPRHVLRYFLGGSARGKSVQFEWA